MSEFNLGGPRCYITAAGASHILAAIMYVVGLQLSISPGQFSRAVDVYYLW